MYIWLPARGLMDVDDGLGRKDGDWDRLADCGFSIKGPRVVRRGYRIFVPGIGCFGR